MPLAMRVTSGNQPFKPVSLTEFLSDWAQLVVRSPVTTKMKQMRKRKICKRQYLRKISLLRKMKFVKSARVSATAASKEKHSMLQLILKIRRLEMTK